MNKEEFLKIKTCVLKVNIHCDGCKQKVKKILQKIDGVYTIKIDSEQGKVTVSGNIDAATLVKKLTKNGKHAEIWGASKANNNHQNHLNNQLKNLHIDNGKGGNNKGQGQKNGGNNQPKGGPLGQNPQIQQQLQQWQQLKGFQGMRMPINNKDQNQNSVKFSLPEEDDDYDDDDYDDDDDDDYDDDDDDDYDDDEMADMPMHNKKPVMGNGHGGAQMPNVMMMKGVGNAGNNGGNGAGNLNKGGSGGGNIPVQMNLGGANGGKKGGNVNNNVGNQNQGGGKGGKNGGGQPQDGKNGGGHNKNGNGGGGGGGGGGGEPGNGINFNANGAKNGGGMMPNTMMNVGQMGKNMPMPMGQMGNLPMGQMGNLSAVQGLPASAANGGGGGGAGYFPGVAAPEQMAGNPYYQQQLATMMMNQQRANGNERFHPMMYARPPPAVNYMPPYPPYPYPPPPGDRIDQYSMFSDENTSSCTVM